ncbi:hypothetical protein JTB14_029008 [Gonioctena quinquepunctata]|nr:hypothetical protein JTB14_029008 [Gonioctena quinquepunctata]
MYPIIYMATFALFFSDIVVHSASVSTAVPELNRKILGSYGPFRDFQMSDCDEPLEGTSNCDNWTFAYHWNNQLKGCERLIYHGCQATRNNFITLRDCEKQAHPVCINTYAKVY